MLRSLIYNQKNNYLHYHLNLFLTLEIHSWSKLNPDIEFIYVLAKVFNNAYMSEAKVYFHKKRPTFIRNWLQYELNWNTVFLQLFEYTDQSQAVSQSLNAVKLHCLLRPRTHRPSEHCVWHKGQIQPKQKVIWAPNTMLYGKQNIKQMWRCSEQQAQHLSLTICSWPFTDMLKMYGHFQLSLW